MRLSSPIVYLLLCFGALLFSMIPINFLGFSTNGWGWLIILIVSLLKIFHSGLKRKIFYIWSLWITFLLFRLSLQPSVESIQYTAQLITPLLLGMAIATTRLTETINRKIFKLIFIAAPIFYILQLIFILSKEIPGGSLVMTDVIFCTVFITHYSYNKSNKSLIYFILFLFHQILSKTRMSIFMTLISIPLSIKKMNFKKKTISILLIAIISIGIFYSPIIQNKMFFSGHGQISDLNFNNPDLRTSGRTTIWLALIDDLDNNWLFGHGSRSSYFFMKEKFVTIHEPHNDYIRLIYDFGIVGLVIYFFCFTAQILTIFFNYRARTNLVEKQIDKIALILLVLFLGFMITDNTILYAVTYTNFVFYFIGLSFANNTKIPDNENPESI